MVSWQSGFRIFLFWLPLRLVTIRGVESGAMKRSVVWLVVCLGLGCGVAAPFRIEVVDEESGWPVPLVELETTHSVKFVSDNAGRIAFDLPELMGVETWLSVRGHGYEVKKDGFGYAGVRLTPESGGQATVRVKRRLPGRRIGRLTGVGLFAESQKLGLETDWQESGVLGCDSVQIARYRGRVHWAWGDTILAHYPLGLFHMLGATTEGRPYAGLEPPLRPQFGYFRSANGRVRNTAEMPGTGPTWVSGFIALKDAAGEERLVGHYVKVKPPLSVYESGLCVWNDGEERFELLKVLWNEERDRGSAPPAPDGHPVRVIEDGKGWVVFGDPFPDLKCPDSFEAWADPDQWVELEPQKTVPRRDGGEAVVPHRGSIQWSEWRQAWVGVFTRMGGEASQLGEIWYAEAPHWLGPWRNAVQVVAHDNYTFYNPRIHAEFTEEGSPLLFFEATYTREFAHHAEPTARHNYNQILYRLDLDDPDLVAGD